MAQRQRPQGSRQHLAPAAAATLTRTQSTRKHLSVYAGELAVEPCLQILRRHRRSLLLRLEQAHRPALENNVHSPPQLGTRRSLIVRIGIKSRNKPAVLIFYENDAIGWEINMRTIKHVRCVPKI